jgi:segregation and condensation protein A
VFARGRPDSETTGRASDLTDLLRACLVALQVPAHQAAERAARPPRLWQASEAIGFLRARLAMLPDPTSLSEPLPPLAPGPHTRLRHRAALASTLVAGLELARDTVLTVEQDTLWAPILVTRRPLGPGAAASAT